jgi:transketolase
MRALPKMRVADPGDNADLRAVMRAAMATPGPVYFRVTRYAMPELFGPDHAFTWGRGEVLRAGSDVTLFGAGLMTGFCVRAADLLAVDGIDAEVVHLASIKPIDRDLIAESTRRTGCAVTAENASIVGGLGAAVAEVVAETHPAPLYRIGVRDRWVDSGGIGELLAHHKMRPEDIADAARGVVERKLDS